MIIGVISDTHGLLRPEAVAALRGVDRIIHAGDIGAPEILVALGALAPLTAVRGNNDRDAWADQIPHTAAVDTQGGSIYVLHDRNQLDLDPAVAGFRVVVAGHSHQPGQEERGGVLFFNPGSAGPRRFRLPISIGLLKIDNEGIRGEIATLTDQG